MVKKIKKRGSKLPPIVNHILYGDIHEMPLNVLGKECPRTPLKLTIEQEVRLAMAATIQAWLKGRLHRGGYLWDSKLHFPKDRI